MAQLIRKTESSYHGPWLLDKAALAELDEIIVDQVGRLASALANDLDQGKGLAGAMFKDEELRANLSATLANLNTVSSNLARYGLLYKPKAPRPARASRPPYPGYSPSK